MFIQLVTTLSKYVGDLTLRALENWVLFGSLRSNQLVLALDALRLHYNKFSLGDTGHDTLVGTDLVKNLLD